MDYLTALHSRKHLFQLASVVWTERSNRVSNAQYGNASVPICISTPALLAQYPAAF